MLLGNYNVLSKSPKRVTTGTTQFTDRSNWGQSGAMRGVQCQLGQTVAFPLYAKPNGYYPSYTWMLPQISGSIAAGFKMIDGSGIITNSNLAAGSYIESSIAAGGDLSVADLSGLALLASSITGSGTIAVANANMLAIISASLNGDGTLSGAAILAANLSSSLVGGANLSASISGASFMQAGLTGDGVFAADGSLAAALAAALAGSGIVVADINGVWTMESAISAGGTLDADIAANANMNGAINGAGTISNATPYAVASMACAIKSFGDLTPEGLAAAVWSALGSQFQANGTMGLLLNSAGSGGIDPALVAKIVELWQLQGLDPANPMTVTTDSRVAGDVELQITGDGITTTTVTRQ